MFKDVNVEELYPDVQRVYNSGQLAITETMVEEQGFKFKAS